MPIYINSSGQFCTEDVNECDLMPNSCQNGGTCLNTQGGYNCVCVNGWTGDDCSENIDDCADAACHAGATCHDRVASFLCECPHGRTGVHLFFSLMNHMHHGLRHSFCYLSIRFFVSFEQIHRRKS